MCGRYIYSLTNKELKEIAEQAQKNLYDQQMYGDIFPSNVAPILIRDDIEIKSVLAKWGLKSYDNKNIIINARVESIKKKPTFKKLINSGKCIIPALAFYEWKDNGGKKEKYVFDRNGEVIYMAGLYEMYESEENRQISMFGADEPKQEMRYTIITKDANDSVKSIHQRMPLILSKNEIKEWLMDDNIDGIVNNNNVDLSSKKTD